MTKTPNQAGGYYAVRQGKSVRACIFMYWQDCKEHVDGFKEAEYSVFDNITDAISYTLSQNVHAHVNANELHNSDLLVPASIIIAVNNPDSLPPSHIMNGSSSSSRSKDNNNDDRLMPNNRNTTPQIHPQVEPQALDTLTRANNPDGLEGLANWAADPAKRTPVQNNKQMDPKSNKKRRKTYDSSSCGIAAITNRKPTKKWEEMFEALKSYKEKHDNRMDSDADNPVVAELKAWVAAQQNQYKTFKEGKKSSMTYEKENRLMSLGFDFDYISWEDQFNELKSFKEDFGTCDVPLEHPDLGKWFQKQHEQCGLFLKGKPCHITKEQMENLFALGLDPGTVADTFKKRNSALLDDRWDEQFAALVEFKAQHNHCRVPVTEKTTLSKWVVTQRVEYKKLQDGNASRLTLLRLQRLNDLGFVFRQCDRYIRFDDWLQKLTEYKAENGDCRVPKKSETYPELGNWICRQRQEYKRFCDGGASTMTQERVDQLSNVGFVFQAGKRLGFEHRERKSWNERFQELLQYKEMHGHTIVPQNYPKLGEWVKSQRKSYKWLKEGKKTSMNTEQALKLADCGFVFDATNRRGNKS